MWVLIVLTLSSWTGHVTEQRKIAEYEQYNECEKNAAALSKGQAWTRYICANKFAEK